TLMLAGNIPGRTQTLPMAIYFAVEGGDFREAALWSSAILILSLGAIVLVNQFAHQKTRLRRNLIFLSSSSPFKSLKNHRASPLSLPLSRLEVTIRKKLPTFELSVSFSTDHQHPLGLLGASGAGKSLILRCIAGIETPDEGRIVLNGRVLFDSEKEINVPSCDRRVGILFQNYALFPHLSVADNVAFGSQQLSSYQSSEIKAAVAQQLSSVQLGPLSGRYPSELSGGQQQ
ncbi:MAG: ATP-binding cassette domain-containing protein, partial [Cyanobacteria bacterium J06576_12]